MGNKCLTEIRLLDNVWHIMTNNRLFYQCCFTQLLNADHSCYYPYFMRVEIEARGYYSQCVKETGC